MKSSPFSRVVEARQQWWVIAKGRKGEGESGRSGGEGGTYRGQPWASNDAFQELVNNHQRQRAGTQEDAGVTVRSEVVSPFDSTSGGE